VKKGNQFLHFLREIAIVVIGVLIAVSIADYKEKADNETYIEKTLLAIENEIELSKSDVDTVLKRHLSVVEDLVESGDDIDEQTLAELISNLGGIQFPSIKNISLRFFISNKAELVDFELISELLEIETLSNMLSDKMKRLADFAYEQANDKEIESKITFTYLLADVIDSEKALMISYENFLDNNKAYLHPESQ
jgi:hypothetical protein